LYQALQAAVQEKVSWHSDDLQATT